MKNKRELPENFNSAFVNVTISAKKIGSKYPLYELLKSARGNWIMSNETADKIKYIYPVRKNEILGVFEVTGYEAITNQDSEHRVRFDIKPIFINSTRLTESAKDHQNKVPCCLHC